VRRGKLRELARHMRAILRVELPRSAMTINPSNRSMTPMTDQPTYEPVPIRGNLHAHIWNGGVTEVLVKPILCIDFDGVIHSYDAGWQNGDIYGRATEGFFEWALKAQEKFKLVVYSSRSKTYEGRVAMERAIMRWFGEWLAPRSFPEGKAPSLELDFAHEKPPAFLTIDDRAMQFRGDWADMNPDTLAGYEVWNKPFDKAEWERKEPARRARENAEQLARADWADRKVPWYLRLLGVPKGAYMGDGRERSYRTWWGEIAFGSLLFAFMLTGRHLHIAIPGVQAFINLPLWARLKSKHGDHEGSWKDDKGRWFNSRREFGISFRFGQDWGGSSGYGSIAWDHRSASFSLPWGWNRRKGDYRREYMDAAGEWHDADLMPKDWMTDEQNAELGPLPWSQTYTFHYMCQPSGKAQHVPTTIQRERRTDTYRVFGFVTRTRVQDLIDIRFHEEVGNQRGSWKGGVCGTSATMKPGETPGETLRRFQREQAGGRFDR